MPHFPKRLNKDNFKTFLDSFDTVLTDCDGVLWDGGEVIGKANEVLNKLQAHGKKVFYVSNNSNLSRDEFVKKCQKLGFTAEKESIVSSSYVMAQYLKQIGFDKKVYVVGTGGMTDELDSVGIAHTGVRPEPIPDQIIDLIRIIKLDPDVGAVAVGFDPHINFSKIMRAGSYLENKDCLFIATNADVKILIPNSNLVFPGTKCIISAIEAVAEHPPIIMGKPSEKMFTVISEKHKLDPKRTLMIGDNCNTDILFGKNCGLHTLVVLTGVAKMEDFEEYVQSNNEETLRLLADYYIDGLGDILEFFD